MEILVQIGTTEHYVDIGEDSPSYGWIVRSGPGRPWKVQKATALAVSLAKSKYAYEQSAKGMGYAEFA